MRLNTKLEKSKQRRFDTEDGWIQVDRFTAGLVLTFDHCAREIETEMIDIAAARKLAQSILEMTEPK